jgi:hypothetical protein
LHLSKNQQSSSFRQQGIPEINSRMLVPKAGTSDKKA